MRFQSLMKAFVASCAVFASSALGATWTIQQVQEAEMGAVSFGDANTGFIAGGTSNGGPNMLKTTDGGNTWNQIPIASNDMILFDVSMANATNGVAAGISVLTSSDQFTVDGNQFRATPEKFEATEQCQSAERISGTPLGFGLTGAFGSVNGVGITLNGGYSYTHFDCQQKQQIPARYGAFPSTTQFIVAAGQWPSNKGRLVKLPRANQLSSHESYVYSLTRFVHQEFTVDSHYKIMKKGRLHYGLLENVLPETAYISDSLNAINGWAAAIQRTTDGGKTWSNVFTDYTFYFNMISCPSTRLCFAVGENDSAAFIFRSTDGGQTWNKILTDQNGSLMAVHFLSEKEGWAGGGVQSDSFTGHAWHTVDGGNTWNLNKVPGVYFNDFSFVNPSLGWAVAFDELETSLLLKYN